MIVSSPLTFPTSRVWSTWWHDLTPWRPRRLWLACWRVHRVEALVIVNRRQPLDPWHRQVLRALALSAATSSEPVTLPVLDAHLHLGPPVLARALAELASLGLIQALTSESWQLAEVGRQALRCEHYSHHTHERRTFFFVENASPESAPTFLPLAEATGISWPPETEGGFHAQHLRACIQSSPEWKQQAHFPSDVQELAGTDEEEETETSDPLRVWRRVILDHIERWRVLLVQGQTDEHDGLLGFAVSEADWTLRLDRPVLRLSEGWPEVWPELAAEPTAEQLRQAWLAWCQRRHLSGAEMESCPLRLTDHRLQATLSAPMVEHIRDARPDVLQGAAWLLIGADPNPQAAQIEIMESGPAAIED
ncbi:MAG: hypothetical protein ACK4RK_14830 [Gemmataceae bacterium]